MVEQRRAGGAGKGVKVDRRRRAEEERGRELRRGTRMRRRSRTMGCGGSAGKDLEEERESGWRKIRIRITGLRNRRKKRWKRRWERIRKLAGLRKGLCGWVRGWVVRRIGVGSRVKRGWVWVELRLEKGPLRVDSGMGFEEDWGWVEDR